MSRTRTGFLLPSPKPTPPHCELTVLPAAAIFRRFCGRSSVVELNLAKVDVVGSNPIGRSKAERVESSDSARFFLTSDEGNQRRASRRVPWPDLHWPVETRTKPRVGHLP